MWLYKSRENGYVVIEVGMNVNKQGSCGYMRVH